MSDGKCLEQKWVWRKTVINLKITSVCQISLRASEGGGLGSLREDNVKKTKIMTYFYVVENVRGGVRSHPPAIKF